MGKEKIDGLMVLLQTLPGISFTYYGDELGMEDNAEISWDETTDIQACNADQVNYQKYSRDVARTPFLWDGSANAGFSSGKPWLPVHSSFAENNLAAQVNANRSHYKLFKELLALRKGSTFVNGDLDVKALSTNVLGYTRTFNGDAYIVAINLGSSHETVDVSVFNIGLDESQISLVLSIDSSHNSG
jgi:alpha-glucosidase